MRETARAGVTVTRFADPRDAATVRRAARATLSVLGCRKLGVEIIALNAAESAGFNRRFRGKRKVAEVLSFASPSAFPGGPMGEVFICPAAVTHASRARYLRRLAELSVHGVLHILGYRHDSPCAESQMQSLHRVLARMI